MKIKLKRSNEFALIKLTNPIKIDNVNGTKSYAILTDFRSVSSGLEPNNINLDALVHGYMEYTEVNDIPVTMEYRLSTQAGRLTDSEGNFILFKGNFDDLDKSIPVAKGKGNKITHIYVGLGLVPEEVTMEIYDYAFEVFLSIVGFLLFFLGLVGMIYTGKYSIWNWFVTSISLIVGVNSWSRIHRVLHITK